MRIETKLDWTLNKLDPFVWFRGVLARIASHSVQKLDAPLPHRCALANLQAVEDHL
jgi:hypothetical protein